MIRVIYVSILKISERKMISEIYDRGESISLKRNIRRNKRRCECKRVEKYELVNIVHISVKLTKLRIVGKFSEASRESFLWHTIATVTKCTGSV